MGMRNENEGMGAKRREGIHYKGIHYITKGAKGQHYSTVSSQM